MWLAGYGKSEGEAYTLWVLIVGRPWGGDANKGWGGVLSEKFPGRFRVFVSENKMELARQRSLTWSLGEVSAVFTCGYNQIGWKPLPATGQQMPPGVKRHSFVLLKGDQTPIIKKTSLFLPLKPGLIHRWGHMGHTPTRAPHVLQARRRAVATAHSSPRARLSHCPESN